MIIKAWIDELGNEIMFLRHILRTLIYRPCRSELIFEQIWNVSMQSLPTTTMAGFFVGAIMAVQFTVQMKEFGALGYLGGLSTSGTFREVGPLLIGFMLSGKIGAYTSAELGTMRVTEQIDALRCLGTDPIRELILPRFIGIVISAFFLFTIGLTMSIGGGALMGSLFAGVNFDEYFRHIPTILTFPSAISGLLKSFCFALVLATICTYKGFNASGGARGVGRAVVSTSVTTMIVIVFTDLVTSWFSEILMQIARGY